MGQGIDSTSLYGTLNLLILKTLESGARHGLDVAREIRVQTSDVLRIEDAASLIILDGLFTFLEPIDSTSKVTYALNGNSGAHVLVAQWNNWKLANGPDGNYANFQLSLDQATGVAEVRFGPNSGGGVLYNNVNGPNCGIFHAPHSFSQCYGKLWAEGNGDSPTLDSLPNFDFDALMSLPSPNTMYRFTPRSIENAIEEAEVKNSLEHQIIDGSLIIRSIGGAKGSVELIDTAGRKLYLDTILGSRTFVSRITGPGHLSAETASAMGATRVHDACTSSIVRASGGRACAPRKVRDESKSFRRGRHCRRRGVRRESPRRARARQTAQ